MTTEQELMAQVWFRNLTIGLRHLCDQASRSARPHLLAAIDEAERLLKALIAERDAITARLVAVEAENKALTLKNGTLRNAWEVESKDRQSTLERLTAVEAERDQLKKAIAIVEGQRDGFRADLQYLVDAVKSGRMEYPPPSPQGDQDQS